MDTIQALLGDLLLILAGLALVMLAVMLLLAQANAVVWLATRLTRSLHADDRDVSEHCTSAGNRPHARSAPSERRD